MSELLLPTELRALVFYHKTNLGLIYPRHKALAGPSKERADALWTGPPRSLAETELRAQIGMGPSGAPSWLY